jgi:hypothetical protein
MRNTSPTSSDARKGIATENVWGMWLLAAFAFFAGVGYWTTMGMGPVRFLATYRCFHSKAANLPIF